MTDKICSSSLITHPCQHSSHSIIPPPAAKAPAAPEVGCWSCGGSLLGWSHQDVAQLCQAGRTSFKQKGNFYTQGVHSLNRGEDSVLTHLMNLDNTSVKMEGFATWGCWFFPLFSLYVGCFGRDVSLSVEVGICQGGGVLFGMWLGSLEVSHVFCCFGQAARAAVKLPCSLWPAKSDGHSSSMSS